MNNVSKPIRQAYYDKIESISVPVYKEDVSIDEEGNHVVIRVEGETDRSNKSKFVTNVVVITDVVTVFLNSIDPDVADDIDQEIRELLKPYVGSRSLQAEGIEISNIKPESSTFLSEDDGTKKYYRKITRWTQRIVQLN